LVFNFAGGTVGDIQKTQKVNLCISGCAFNNIEAIDTAARRSWLVNPNISSFGKSRVAL
jgi:hypothetical protein